MTSIESELREISAPAHEIYAFLSNFNNFESLMPQQVTRWQSTADSCSFNIQGMADIDLRLAEKKENEYIRMDSEGRSPFPFSMIWSIQGTGDTSRVVHKIEAEVNPMLAMMLKAPLQNFVNILVDRLKTLAEEGGLPA